MQHESTLPAHPYPNPRDFIPVHRPVIGRCWFCVPGFLVGHAMKNSIRRIRRMLGGHFWDRPADIPAYASQVVSDEEVEQFIRNIAATGFYDDVTGKLVPASRERREGACDWVELGPAMHPVARAEFLAWARDTAQSTLYGPLSPSDKYSLIFGNQAH